MLHLELMKEIRKCLKIVILKLNIEIVMEAMKVSQSTKIMAQNTQACKLYVVCYFCLSKECGYY